MTEIVEDDKFAACDVVMKTLRRFGRNHAVVPAPDDEGWQVQLSYAVGGSSRPALSGPIYERAAIAFPTEKIAVLIDELRCNLRLVGVGVAQSLGHKCARKRVPYDPVDCGQLGEIKRQRG